MTICDKEGTGQAHKGTVRTSPQAAPGLAGAAVCEIDTGPGGRAGPAPLRESSLTESAFFPGLQGFTSDQRARANVPSAASQTSTVSYTTAQRS